MVRSNYFHEERLTPVHVLLPHYLFENIIINYYRAVIAEF